MLILASQSPRRRHLLAAAGLEFDIRPADVDETTRPGESPGDYVVRLAAEKARAVRGTLELAETDRILAADTTVVLDNEIIGKPESRPNAEDMIGRLAGRTHLVLTAVCIAAPDGRLWQVLVESAVRFRALTASEIAHYVALGESDDKAGAYAVQGHGASLIDRVEGSFTNVIGLPMPETLALLQEAGVHRCR